MDTREMSQYEREGFFGLVYVWNTNGRAVMIYVVSAGCAVNVGLCVSSH